MACHAKNCVFTPTRYSCGDVNIESLLKSSSFEEMIVHYNKNWKAQVTEDLESLTKDQPEELWITNFICGAANRLNDPSDKKFCKNSHQYRMPYETVVKAREVLKGLNLDRLDTFADIFNAVADATRKDEHGEGVEYFGGLACYDFSLRYTFHRGIAPDRVYLHAGTKTGFDALNSMPEYEGIKVYKDHKLGKYTLVSDLPAPLSELSAYHIENFLCIYHKPLQSLAERLTKSSQMP